MEKKSKLFEQRYRKVETIGGGNYGTVFKVELIDKPGTFYALKKINIQADPSCFDGIEISGLREISILKELKHPNIEQLYDTFYDINHVYLALEYVDCGLKDLMGKNGQKGLLNESELKNLMLQILTGIAEIHRNGILHRDLAPSNILVNSEGVVKIADFGLSRYISSPGRPMTGNVTTPNFRAPEIFFGARLYSYSIDIWSIDVSLVKCY